MNDIFSDDIFNSLFNDTADADVGKMFDDTEEKPAEKKTEELVKEEAPTAEEKAEEPVADAPTIEEKIDEPVAEAPKAEEPVAEETPDEQKEEPVKETPVPKETTIAESGDVKEEVESDDAAAEEPNDAESDANAETDATPEENVEADAPAAEEAPAAEPAEPVVEVKAEKKHRRRRSKKTKTEEKAEEPKKAASEEPASSEVNEEFLKSLILVIGPKYKNFRDDINDRINKISIQPDMPTAVINSMIAQNNELEKKLMIEGQGYYDAYTNLTDKETGLIASTRAAAEAEADGTVAERRYAGQVALEHYKFPATGEVVNLLQYANALKQVTNFLDNVKSYVKSTGIALNTMRKVA